MTNKGLHNNHIAISEERERAEEREHAEERECTEERERTEERECAEERERAHVTMAINWHSKVKKHDKNGSLDKVAMGMWGFFTKAEDAWQSKQPPMTHLVLNQQLANSTYGVSQITNFH